MKNYMNILKFIILHTKLCMVKSLNVLFLIKYEYIKKYDSTKYLALFHSDEKYGRIFHRIRYLITLKTNISDIFLINTRKLELLKMVIYLWKNIIFAKCCNFVKSVSNKNHNHY